MILGNGNPFSSASGLFGNPSGVYGVSYEFMGLKFTITPVDKMPKGVLMVIQGKPFQNPDGTTNPNRVSLIDDEGEVMIKPRRNDVSC